MSRFPVVSFLQHPKDLLQSLDRHHLGKTGLAQPGGQQGIGHSALFGSHALVVHSFSGVAVLPGESTVRKEVPHRPGLVIELEDRHGSLLGRERIHKPTGGFIQDRLRPGPMVGGHQGQGTNGQGAESESRRFGHATLLMLLVEFPESYSKRDTGPRTWLPHSLACWR